MSDEPIRIGHPDQDVKPNICGCGDGMERATLQLTENRPNLSTINFRAGDHGKFKASMITSLASAAYPALADLGTRDDDDFTIALIDAWASACDVLTFYQERLANEAYIQTATERLSIGELARLVGYRLHPGAAAETDLVIFMEDPPAAAPDVDVLLVPEGTRVQSQPGPEEMPQVFETIADLDARVAWNTFRPRLSEDLPPSNSDFSTWLEGTPALQVGDAIVIVGRQRSDHDAGSERWDFRRLTAIEPDAAQNRTRVTWDRPLGSTEPPGSTAKADHRFFHLKDRASLFGFNAPHPRVLSSTQRDDFGFADNGDTNSPSRISGDAKDPGDWIFEFTEPNTISLDAVYKSFVKDSWVVLVRPNGLTELYRIGDAKDDAEARYAISGKTTRLTFDTKENLTSFKNDYRRVSVYGGSVEFLLTETPIDRWVAGVEVDLDLRVDGLPKGRRLIFKGKRARLRVEAQSLTVGAEDGAIQALDKDDIVTLLSEPVSLPNAGDDFRFEVVTKGGFRGFATATAEMLVSVPAPDDAEEIAVAATLDLALAMDASHTRLRLSEALPLAFDRVSLRIHANVARAAHGEGVTDILGSGNPSQPFQKFLLKQDPVSHRLAPTETGIASTLSLRVDGIEWQEVPDLYQRGPTARVFKTSLTDTGETMVEFGDGHSGARPTAGRDNIVADHSKGIGRQGNLHPGQLTLPLDRPLGLKETINPLAATGGDDPEALGDARRNAPIYTLTLGRVVSLTDYRDFALGFPGIAKAEARWVWQDETRRIMVTVAGPQGAVIPSDSSTYINLLAAFRSLGDPLVDVDLLSFVPAFFRLGLRVAIDPANDTDTVLANTESALRAAFSFEARDFGQILALSEIAAAAHEVEGLRAVDVDLLYRETAPQTAPIAHARLISQPGRQGPDGKPRPAEILTIADRALDKLEPMA